METARDLALRLHDLLRREHGALAEFIVALADFDQRRAWAELGHASLFDYLHRALGLSRGAAFYRKTAAELVQRFPEIVEALRDGRVCLMSVAEVARVLTPENRRDVLPRFFGLSKREARALAAELLPTPDPPLRAIVTAVRPTPRAELALVAVRELPVLPVEPISPAGPAADARPADPPAVPPRPATEPLTAELNRFHVTVSREFLQKLEKARAALSHSRPGASESEILEAGLDLLLERQAKRNGLVEKPRNEPCGGSAGGRRARSRRARGNREPLTSSGSSSCPPSCAANPITCTFTAPAIGTYNVIAYDGLSQTPITRQLFVVAPGNGTPSCTL